MSCFLVERILEQIYLLRDLYPGYIDEAFFESMDQAERSKSVPFILDQVVDILQLFRDNTPAHPQLIAQLRLRLPVIARYIDSLRPFRIKDGWVKDRQCGAHTLISPHHLPCNDVCEELKLLMVPIYYGDVGRGYDALIEAIVRFVGFD